MRRRGLVSVIGVIVAGVALASAGAGVAMKLDRKPAQSVIRVVDVDPAKARKLVNHERTRIKRQASMSRRALVKYLKKRYGVNAARAIIQRGKKNYVGPKCPGKGWTCAKPRGVVLQLNQNGENHFRCSESYAFGVPGGGVQDPDGPTCVVIQITASGNNHAQCVEHNDEPVVVQNCTIFQDTGEGNNHARVDQKVHRRDTGTEQDVTQLTEVTQDTGAGNNFANIDQSAHLIIQGSGAQKQDVHQKAVLVMDTELGDNHGNVKQDQNLDEHSSASVVNQRQNTEFNTVAECAFGEEPFAPNSCASVDMNTDEGDNRLNLDQVNRLSMTARRNAVGFEQQGSCESGNDPCLEGESPDGGTEASVDMISDAGNTSSHTTGSAIQKMPKKVDIEQLQFADPWCCFGTFFVGDKVRSDIDLQVDQTADDDAYQAGENGVACVAVGDGDCSAVLTVKNNEGTFTVQAEGDALFGNQECRTDEDTGFCTGEGVVTVTTGTFVGDD